MATGGRDKYIYVWDVLDLSKESVKLEANCEIYCLAFHPKLFWIIAGGENGIKIYDLTPDENNTSNVVKPIAVIEPQLKKDDDKTKKSAKLPSCISISCSPLGNRIYAGFTDNLIRVYSVNQGDSTN